jgi:hypothetical protein
VNIEVTVAVGVPDGTDRPSPPVGQRPPGLVPTVWG